MNLRWAFRISFVVVTAALMGSVVGLPYGAATAQPPTGDPVLHPTGALEVGPLEVRALSPSGRYGVISDINGDQIHIDFATDVITSIPKLRPYPEVLDDGRTIIGSLLGSTSGTLQRIDIVTLESEPVEGLVASDVLLDLLDAWPGDADLVSVVSETPDGRYQLAYGRVEGSSVGRYWVYDTVEDRLVTPFADGLGDDMYTTDVKFSTDGTTVRYTTYCCIGAWLGDYIEFDLATGERTTIVEQPDELAGHWQVSDDYNWILFPSTSAALGADPAGPAEYFRRHVATGTTTMVPGASAAEQIAIFDDGHVMFRTPDGEDAGFFSWTGGSTSTVLSTSLLDGPSSFTLLRGQWNDDGSVLAYAAFQPALANPGPHLFTVGSFGPMFSLPTADGAARLVDTRLTNTPVAAASTRCVPAVGADPGDYITVNVTPVEATTFGHGTIHSSDDPAGDTSNVNFGPGTVDPNTTTVHVGTDGNICFTNSIHGPVHLIIDELIVAPR